MAKFRFNLDPLLRMRHRAEREKQAALAAAQQERLTLEDAVREMQARIVGERDELRAVLAGGRAVDLGAAKLQASASLNAVARTQQLALKLAGAHRRVEHARQELLEAARQRRAVELLREKRFEAWKSEQAQRENSAIDELAIMSGTRSAAGERGDR